MLKWRNHFSDCDSLNASGDFFLQIHIYRGAYSVVLAELRPLVISSLVGAQMEGGGGRGITFTERLIHAHVKLCKRRYLWLLLPGMVHADT